jgi:acetyl-CoA carboxylase biotin carboxyl carrier protein
MSGDASVPFDVAGIRKVLDAFEKSHCSEVHLRSGDFELIVSADGDHRTPTSASPTATVTRQADLSDKNQPDAPPAHAADAAEPTGAPESAEGEPASPAGQPGRTIEVAAPSVGIFWRSPQPGAPPFVSVGDAVEPDTTVCIIEVMKLMNHVKAGASGRIAEVHSGNGEQVATDQALFTIEVSD